ncbi:hypothetical protein [Aquimarina sp. 2201CG14-23]|uniref:hypothetical protein n=1 Tax=Aquimarina mycalae TaxID=3040073 RepID=UPI002477F570|nr:hypothetical protein [Aquimarina sp. 2201CG14-23]MDH7445966.1 hypothetical protein [Aquimarina sp. 2201CG14-23]
MEELLQNKLQKIITLTINDDRWDLTNETMFQIFGLTLSGFSFGVGRNLCFLDAEVIAKFTVSELTKLGAGKNYVEGLVASAFDTFENETKSYQSDIVGIGYFHFSSENLNDLKESIFSNSISIEQQSNLESNETNPRVKKSKKWWKFGK